MKQSRTILAIFRDAEDEALWSSVLGDINDMVRVVACANLAITLENLQIIGIEPSLTIFSTRLYPRERPDLIACVRRYFATTDFLLVSSSNAPAPPMQPLINDKVRHLVINPDGFQLAGSNRQQMLRAVKKLVEGSVWEMHDYLTPGTPIHEFQISLSDQKEELISAVASLIPGDSPESEILRQKGELLADEMLENAMYGAPRGHDGNKIFRKGEKRAILPGERIAFRVGFDGETLAMEIADGWGSLSPEMVMAHLETNRECEEMCDESGGRGLFIIWRFLDQLHVSINTGKQTVVGGQIRLYPTVDPLTAPKGFHITTCQ